MIRSREIAWRILVACAVMSTLQVAVCAESDRRDVSHANSSVERAISGHLATGKQLLQQGAARDAQAEFRAILQLDATHPEALRLMTKAQRQLEAQQAKAERERAHLRNAALDVAVKLAREKANEQARKEAKAREQVAHAREQQVKLLYAQGLALYREHRYQDAVERLQQMALIDPNHPLVREAQRLITRADMKQAELRAQLSARGAGDHAPASVSDLEQQLTAKRIELETEVKYAKLAMKDRQYDQTIALLQRVLVQDPHNSQAQQLLEQAQMAKLHDEEQQLKKTIARDEQSMVNDVLKAQVLPPEPKPVRWTPPAVTQTGISQAMVTALKQPISLDFNEVPLSDVLEFIGDTANISILPSPQLDLKSRRVSMKVTDLPLEQALKYLVKSQSLAYRVDEDAIVIATAEEFSNEPLQTHVFFLKNGLSPFALETAAVESNPALPMESIKNLVERTIPQPPNSKLVIDERSGALIVTNTTENLTRVEGLLSQLDVTPVQVLIEARFIEVDMTNLDQRGLESVLTGNAALDKKGDRDSRTRGPGDALTSGSGEKFPSLARKSEGLNLTLEGVLTGTQFESVLHLLEESQKSKTLSAPRVTALNNRTAQIRVVEEFNYPTRYEVSLVQFDINGDGDFKDAGETEFVNVPKDFKKRDVGILLNVTPSVGKDMKTITLVLVPEVSAFSQFRDLGGGVTVPEFTSSQLTTSVVIEEGQTVVLGGLMKDTTAEQITKIPVLGDLPMVGGLFRQKQQTSTRKNLLIFITAHLLAPRGPTT